MQISVNPHIVIHATPIEVFARLTEIENWPLWGGNLASMERVSDGPLRAGSQIRQVTKSGRNPEASIVQVTEVVPGRSFGIKGSNVEGVFALEPVEAGTQLHARFDVEASGLAAMMYRLMLKRFVMQDLKRFRKMVESKQS